MDRGDRSIPTTSRVLKGTDVVDGTIAMVAYVIYAAVVASVPLAILYGLVKFVKWAWVS